MEPDEGVDGGKDVGASGGTGGGAYDGADGDAGGASGQDLGEDAATTPGAADEGPSPSVGPPARLLLVGVGHVFDLRDPLRRLIHAERPDAVLVELDGRRYAALTQPDAAEQARPARGLYGILARFQRKAAASLGTTPGEEMVVAVEAAKEAGAKAGLIDMDAQVAFARMWKAMSIREKLRFLWAAITALFASEERIEEEVSELSGDYTDLMEAFAAQFPSAKRVLLDERDELMARRVRAQAGALGPAGRVVVVVGDGHVEGMADRLADLEPTVVRLRELLDGDDASKAQGEPRHGEGTASASFSVEVGSRPGGTPGARAGGEEE